MKKKILFFLLLTSLNLQAHRFEDLQVSQIEEIECSDKIKSIVPSPDGKRVAIVGRNFVKITKDISGKLEDFLSVEDVVSFTVEMFYPKSVIFSPDGKMLACLDGFDIYLLNFSNFNFMVKEKIKSDLLPCNFIAFSPDGRTFAYVCEESIVLTDILNVEKNKV